MNDQYNQLRKLESQRTWQTVVVVADVFVAAAAAALLPILGYQFLCYLEEISLYYAIFYHRGRNYAAALKISAYSHREVFAQAFKCTCHQALGKLLYRRIAKLTQPPPPLVQV